ncbi:helix-turn-helix transcriptional regulator [Actinomycetospora termitidis]|uniref:LuxR C-terminal-related transcriptional regulator n=1 Tax=Actinomycetospora termitidis TaxID=3053470 RepID=A0ABT7M133_9PSEU|nr:LuxR family transcriptional regulator [Actinomycetospora sp. Odt1-22]MDL5154365.1 LuxR C-terminal-related transcriptional regulator [Actinomycetospora sp. Odt1-22]
MDGGRLRVAGTAEGEAAGDPMVAGLPGAVALLTTARADPQAPLTAAVVGPGGSGKSALLSALVRSARRRGVATRRIRAGDTVPFPSDQDALLLVDDAHLLDASTLAELTDVADDPDARLVVTARPWPCPRALSTLWLALGRARAPVALAPLTSAGVGERASALLGSRCPPALASTLHRLSAGSPAVLDRLVTQIRDSGAGGISAAAEPGSAEVPPGALDLLRHEILGLDSEARRLLLAIAVGAPRVPAALADVLDVDRTTLDDHLDRARASGLLLPTPGATVELGAPAEGVAPLVRRCLVRLGSADERLDLERRIAEQALARGASVLEPARRLLGSGLRGGDLPRVFTAAGDEALASAPHLAGALYADAVAAGAAPDSVVLRRAEAAALAGDLDTALRLADPLTSASDPDEHARAVMVVAAVMAHRGMGRGAAEMLAGVPRLHALAVPGLVGAGEITRATELLDTSAADHAGSTTVRSAVALAAQGVLTSLDARPGAAATALSDLTRATSLLEPLGAGVLLPDSPSATAALVALHAGDLELADSVLRRACDSAAGGPALAPRHHLLRAWVAMLRGDVAEVREHVTAARSRRGLEPRDELPAAALEVGVARRTGDSAALRAAWGRAREALVRHPVDLFVLLPLGELAVGAARLKEQAAVASAWEAADDLLRALGDPPLWRTTTAWYGLAAALTAEDVPAAERHLGTLEAFADRLPIAATLATAARVWVRTLSGEIDPIAVEQAARGLHRLGWTWDGARLAGEAAIRTRDRRAMATLLACARSLADVGRPGDGAAQIGVPTSGLVGDPGEVSLSEREQEVARLVLAGLTHKQIGARLYISAKTVEHHVARMRQRLGSSSRGELFAQLRELVGGPG